MHKKNACELKCQAFSMLNISQVILMRTDSNLRRKELTVHWSAPNSLIRSYLQPCTNSMWGDESEAVAPIIWLYQIVDAQKEEVFFPELLTTLRSYVLVCLHSKWEAKAEMHGPCSDVIHDCIGARCQAQPYKNWPVYRCRTAHCTPLRWGIFIRTLVTECRPNRISYWLVVVGCQAIPRINTHLRWTGHWSKKHPWKSPIGVPNTGIYINIEKFDININMFDFFSTRPLSSICWYFAHSHLIGYFCRVFCLLFWCIGGYSC